jgi:transcriptional regulator with XRE-family HTH domain
MEGDMAQRPDYFVWTTSAELGQAVLVAREAMGLKQAELAARAGVGRKFLWQLESGKATLRNDKVMRVLEELSLMPLIVPRELLGMLR